MTKKKEKKVEQQEMTETTGTELAQPPAGAWGGEEVTSEDIIVPKIALLQPMSKLVVEKEIGRPGELRDSLQTDRVLGGIDKPVDIVVFGSFKRINRYKDDEWDGSEEWHKDFEREEVNENGEVIIRKVSLNFYCIAADDIKNGTVFPYVVSFKGMSTGAGKALSTHIKKLEVFKKPSAAKVFQLGVSKESNDKGTFFTYTVTMGRDTTNGEIASAYEWYKAFSKSQVKVDEAGDADS